MAIRQPRFGEVEVFYSDDSQTAIAIIKRDDGLFQCLQDGLHVDEEEGVEYWSPTEPPLQGLFGNIDEARQSANELISL